METRIVCGRQQSSRTRTEIKGRPEEARLRDRLCKYHFSIPEGFQRGPASDGRRGWPEAN